MFGRTVGTAKREAKLTGNRCRNRNISAACIEHHWKDGFGDSNRRKVVDLHDLAHHIHRSIFDTSPLADTCIEEKNIYSAKTVPSLTNK